MIVCTVLTGTLAIAMLEKTCPAIWNRLITNVPWNMTLDGFLIPHPAAVAKLVCFPALIPPIRSRTPRITTQYHATNANWTMVRVTG